jgi:hypothetical protein
MDQNEIPHDPCTIGVPSGASKTIFEPMVRSTQTEQLSCIKIHTISKRTEMTFHLCLVTREYHRVCPKWLLSLWYVWRKLFIFHALKLTLSPTRSKQDSTCPCPLAVPSGAYKTISKLMVRSAQTLRLSCVKIRTIPKRTEMNYHLSLVT